MAAILSSISLWKSSDSGATAMHSRCCGVSGDRGRLDQSLRGSLLGTNAGASMTCVDDVMAAVEAVCVAGL